MTTQVWAAPAEHVCCFCRCRCWWPPSQRHSLCWCMVLVLCLFAFFVFGVVAVQLFAGALRSTCAGTHNSCQHGSIQQCPLTPGSSWRAADICKCQLPAACRWIRAAVQRFHGSRRHLESAGEHTHVVRRVARRWLDVLDAATAA